MWIIVYKYLIQAATLVPLCWTWTKGTVEKGAKNNKDACRNENEWSSQARNANRCRVQCVPCVPCVQACVPQLNNNRFRISFLCTIEKKKQKQIQIWDEEIGGGIATPNVS